MKFGARSFRGFNFSCDEDNGMRRTFIALATFVACVGATGALAADGKAVYTKACAVCHATLPPKLGDKAAWEPRLKQGIDAMVVSVVKGKGAMPPRAGSKSLTDEEIRAAVEYVAAQAR